MEIHDFINKLSVVLAAPETVGTTLAGTAGYFTVVVLAIVVFAGTEGSAALQIRGILKGSASDTDKIVLLDNLVNAQIPGTTDALASEPARFWARVWNSVAAPQRTRLGRSTGALLRAFAANAEGTHQKAGILPAENFLEYADPGPRFKAARWFDVLIRISLIVTFAGIAAVLHSTGLAVASLGDAATAGGSDMIGMISPIISASATKFFTTVFALVFGTAFLVLSYVADFAVALLFRATAAGLDALLKEPSVSKVYAQDPESVLSGAKQEEKQVLRALRENAENIAKIGKSFDTDILGAMRTLLAEQGSRFSDLIDQLGALLNGLYTQGIALPIQSSVSQDVRALMEELTRAQSGVIFTLIEQQEANRAQTDAVVGVIYRLAKAHLSKGELDEIFGNGFEKHEAARSAEREARAERQSPSSPTGNREGHDRVKPDRTEPVDEHVVIDLTKQFSKGKEQQS